MMGTEKEAMPALGEVKSGPRGFPIIMFMDHMMDEPCSLQLSSLVGDLPPDGDLNKLDSVALAFPGSSFIWLGKGSDRMHMGREQVKDLVARLNEWLETGKIEDNPSVPFKC